MTNLLETSIPIATCPWNVEGGGLTLSAPLTTCGSFSRAGGSATKLSRPLGRRVSRSAEGSPCPVDRLTCRFVSAIAAGVVGAVWASVRGGPSCASAGIGSGGRCERWWRGSCCAQAGAVHGCGLTRMEYYNGAGPHIWVTRGPFTSDTSMARPGHNVPIHR